MKTSRLWFSNLRTALRSLAMACGVLPKPGPEQLQLELGDLSRSPEAGPAPKRLSRARRFSR